MLNVVVVEDDSHLLASVRQALEAPESGMCLVGAFSRGSEAISWLQRQKPVDCALVDLGLPDRSGVEVLAELRRTHPTAAGLVFTIFDDDEHLFPALRAGAQGYLLKDSSPEVLLRSIREAVAGGAPMTPAVARKVVQRFWAPPVVQREPLTARERELLVLLCHGASYDAAAARMKVSLSTIQAHVRSTYRKLAVNSKAEALRMAVRLGLFVP
ncbi:response regulator transcription factor [Archangium sp.]|uniref:response regulator transcription factor n=1 Tax=Archangium sp. TaxID=1872627 RepID=UPI00286A7FB9|nr:response regulator transcription factor [Archangium sp.]